MPRPKGHRRAFTLLELLVSVGIIAVLLGITLPSLGMARENAKRVRCLANLKGVGVGMQVYLNEREGFLPYALPLDDSRVYGTSTTGAPQPDSILAAMTPMLDSTEVLICPSDGDIPPELDSPVGKHCSYEYWAGVLMLAREIFRDDQNPVITVTRFYEINTDYPVFADSAPRHPGGREYDQVALYFGDWRADWLVLDPSSNVARPRPPAPPAD